MRDETPDYAVIFNRNREEIGSIFIRNAAISGICIAEAITTLIEETPGLDETFIDIIAETVKDMIRKKGQIQ